MFRWRNESIESEEFSLPPQFDNKIQIFKRYVKTSGQGLAITDLQGRIHTINSAACTLLDIPKPKQLFKTSLLKYYSLDSDKQMQTTIFPYILKHDKWAGNFCLTNKSGQHVPVLLSIFLLRDNLGYPHGMANIFTELPSKSVNLHIDTQPPYVNHDDETALSITPLQKNNDELCELIKKNSSLINILEKTEDLVALSDIDGKILYVNESFRKIFGWQSEERSKEHFIPEVHPHWAFKKVADQGIPQAIEKGSWQGQTAVLCFDGKELHVSQTIMSHRSDNGKVNYISTIMREMHESQARELPLWSSNPQNTIMETMNQLAWICDTESNTTYQNPQYSTYIGSNDEGITHWETIVHPDDLWQIQNTKNEAIIYKRSFQAECRLRRHDGEYRWFMINGNIVLSHENTLTAWVGTATDIDELKTAHNGNNDAHTVFEEAERIGNTGTWSHNLNTSTILLSKGSCKILDFPDCKKVSFTQFISKIAAEDRNCFEQKIKNATLDGLPFTIDLKISSSEDNARHVIIRAESKHSQHSTCRHIHGTLHDITDRKWIEEERIKSQKLESIGTLAAGIAHDYNNLLTGIIGNVELAKVRTSPSDQSFTFLSRAEKSAMSARDLTSHLLCFAGTAPPIKKTLHITDTLKGSLEMAIGNSDIETVLCISDAVPPIMADEIQMHQAIHAIATNAREAMPSGGKLVIKAEYIHLDMHNPFALHEGPYISLVFHDEGVGIEQENLPKIFDPYFSTKRLGTIKGMGLGLSICYSIIKKHDGHISIDSKPGSGTTVSVYIPAT